MSVAFPCVAEVKKHIMKNQTTLITEALSEKERRMSERNEKNACKIHCCMWPYQNGSGWNECVCFQFGFEMRNFNLTTSLSRENITQFLFIRCPCILHKCAPKILIKFIYINAVQFFRIVVWFARREVWKGAQGKGKKEQQHNFRLYEKANSIEFKHISNSPTQIKFNDIKVIVQANV